MSQDSFGDSSLRFAATGDVVLVSSDAGIFGLDRTSGVTVFAEATSAQVTSAPAIGPNRFFAARLDGVHAYGPL